MNSVEIQGKLNDSGLCWFLDSGSLLGMIREGAFLKHDHDIDIGILSENCSAEIDIFISAMHSEGFRVIKYYWGNILYKCKLIPKSEKVFPYILDMQFYRKCGNELICPQMVFKEKLSVFQKLKVRWLRLRKSGAVGTETKKFGVKTLLKRIIRKIFIRDIISVQCKKSTDLYDLYVWIIPESYLDGFSFVNGYRIFRDKEQYLTYRYGDWHIPVDKWNFTKDDKGLKPIEYEFIRNNYEMD